MEKSFKHLNIIGIVSITLMYNNIKYINIYSYMTKRLMYLLFIESFGIKLLCINKTIVK